MLYNQALDEVLAKEDAEPGMHDMIITGIERVLSETPAEEIKAFSQIKNLSIPQDLLFYWLGYNYTAMEDYANAQVVLEGFLETYPGHDREAEVKILLKKVRAAFFEKDTLGCILPLSGKYKVYGLKILQGIHLALRDISQVPGPKASCGCQRFPGGSGNGGPVCGRACPGKCICHCRPLIGS